MKGENQGNILLGRGAFKLDGNLLGLTRDGGSFKVEYNHRVINADGDRGLVKGRVVREEAKPYLVINHLELLTKADAMHPGIKIDTQTKPGHTIITGTGKIDDEKDYHTVEWVGETKDGREVEIKIENAINLENIDWTLKDKDDVIDVATFQSSYDSEADDEFNENWSVTYKN